jgi:hypothetical protein
MCICVAVCLKSAFARLPRILIETMPQVRWQDRVSAATTKGGKVKVINTILKETNSNTKTSINALKAAGFASVSLRAIVSIMAATSTATSREYCAQLLASITACYIIYRLALTETYPEQPTTITWDVYGSVHGIDQFWSLMKKRNVVAEIKAGAPPVVSLLEAMHRLQLHSVFKSQDPIVAKLKRIWETSFTGVVKNVDGLSMRDSVRTGVFLASCRGPELISWVLDRPLWRLNKVGVAEYLFEFGGRAGDRRTADTRYGNGALLDPYLPSLRAADDGADPIFAALVRPTKRAVVESLLAVPGFGGKSTGFITEHIVESLEVMDEDTNAMPWTSKRGRTDAMAGPNTKKILEAFLPGEDHGLALQEITDRVRKLLPKRIVVDNKPALKLPGGSMKCDGHVAQASLCKVYQTLQFLQSGLTGASGRVAR